ncbi:hypothetical protein VTN00DRAFT_7908 [Thermoascus crustaceus]|uniref:uncharacterized protein n=1 Tax=Thermoascus crustaceus TaxID=5088 RepID=UPI003743C65E
MSRPPIYRHITRSPSTCSLFAYSPDPAAPTLEKSWPTAATESATPSRSLFLRQVTKPKNPACWLSVSNNRPQATSDQKYIGTQTEYEMTSYGTSGSRVGRSDSSASSAAPPNIGTDSRPCNNPGCRHEVPFGAATNLDDSPTASDNREMVQSSGLDSQRGGDDSRAATPSNLRADISTSNLVSGGSECSYTGPRANSREELLKTKMPPLFSPAAGQGVFTPLSHARLEKLEDTEKDEHTERNESITAVPPSPGFSPSSTPQKFTWSHTLPRGAKVPEVQQSPEQGAKKSWGKSATVPRYQHQRFSPYPSPSKSKYKLGAHGSSIALAVIPPVKGLGGLKFDGSSAGATYSGPGLSAAVDINRRGRPAGKSKSHGKSTAVSDSNTLTKEQMKEVVVVSLSVYSFKKRANLSSSPPGPRGFAVNVRINWSTMFIDPCSKSSRRQISPRSTSQRALTGTFAMDDSTSLLQINVTMPALFFRIVIKVTAAVQHILSWTIGTQFVILVKATMSLAVGLILFVLGKLGLEHLVQVEYR